MHRKHKEKNTRNNQRKTQHMKELSRYICSLRTAIYCTASACALLFVAYTFCGQKCKCDLINLIEIFGYMEENKYFEKSSVFRIW